MPKFLFSIVVEADDEGKAIAKFQDENINPSDMDIEELVEEIEYTAEDFKILTGDETETQAIYAFISEDEMVEANFFFRPGNVEVRGIIHKEGDHGGTLHIVYPLVNPVGDPRTPPKAEEVLKSIVGRLKEMNVYKS
jgi:hypothetical protein